MKRPGFSKMMILIIAFVFLQLFIFGFINIRWLILAALVGGFLSGYITAMFLMGLILARQNLIFDEKTRRFVPDTQNPI